MLSYCYLGQVLIFSKYTNLKITDNLHQSLHIENFSPQRSFPKHVCTASQKCSHLCSWLQLLLIQYSVITTRRATTKNLSVFGKCAMDFCMLAVPEDIHIFKGFTWHNNAEPAKCISFLSLWKVKNLPSRICWNTKSQALEQFHIWYAGTR